MFSKILEITQAMTMSDYIAFGSLVIATIALIIAIVTNTKKYELTVNQRTELLNWFNEVSELLIQSRLHILNDDAIELDKLGKLSSLIEYGRFLFPNVDKGDGYGKNNPSAYRGYRDITLEFLIYSYDIIKRKDAKNYLKHLEKLQRLFTSRIFDAVKPQKHNKRIKKYTAISLENEMSLADFLKKDPNKIDCFYPKIFEVRSKPYETKI